MTTTPPMDKSRNSWAVNGLLVSAQNTSAGVNTSMLIWLRSVRSGCFQRAYSQPMPATANTGKMIQAMRSSIAQSASSQSRTNAI